MGANLISGKLRNQQHAYDKNVPLETARYGRGYEVNTEFNLQWNCSRWEL